MKDCSWPRPLHGRPVTKLSSRAAASSLGRAAAPVLVGSDFRLLRDLERVIDVGAEVPASRLELVMSEQQLHRSKVSGTPIDQRRLRPPYRVGAVFGRVQSELLYPTPKDARTDGCPGAPSRGAVWWRYLVTDTRSPLRLAASRLH